MKLFKIPLTYFLIFLITIISCGRDESPQIDIDQEVKVTSVKVIAQTQSILKNSTAQLSVTILPSNATNKVVTWSSSDETIATVVNGLVTGLAAGEVTITAKSDENQAILGTLSLEILGGAETNDITSFIIKGKEATMNGQTLTFEFLEGTELSLIVPTIVHNGESISPSIETPQDFNNPVVYTVTAANGDTKEWEVEVVFRQITSSGLEFITTWKTDNPGATEDNQISIPTFPGEVYDYSVDWGDGSMDSGVTGNIVHTYSSAGTYSVSITGTFPRIYFNNPYNLEPGDDDKIISIDQWGTNSWTSMEYGFAGCDNLQIYTTDIPNLSNVTNLAYMFASCTNMAGNFTFNGWEMNSITQLSSMFYYADAFNVDIGNWDVGNVTAMGSTFLGASAFNQEIGNWDVTKVITTQTMFGYATSFNQDISDWDVGNVISTSDMFTGAESFNQDIGNWDVSNVERMSGMFFKATSFNKDIGNWDVANVTSMNWMFKEASVFNQNIGNWDVSNVVDMNSMFLDATSFDQNIGGWNVANVVQMGPMFAGAAAFNQDIGGWNVSSVIWMYEMFKGATSFDQDLGNWDVSNVSRMEEMFLDAGLSRDNYDNLLEGWNGLPSLQSDVTFHGGNSLYCQGETARQNLIATNGWTITDGGKDCN